ncbi:BnaCnng63750D [Brassica napus]|uniref:BnaCnng63750D protein n=1 Tax=Brassica napus TaxID=3708 RepID=A0A078JRN3_BRANA|nr:BnaCnng63750D [Brassica napus]
MNFELVFIPYPPQINSGDGEATSRPRKPPHYLRSHPSFPLRKRSRCFPLRGSSLCRIQ